VSPTWLAEFSANPIADISSILANSFMRNAALAATAVAVIGGMAGYFVIMRRLVFAGEALSHVAFTAAMGSLLLGFDPLMGVFVITVAVAAGVASVARTTPSYDVPLGITLAWVLGLGALLLTIYTSSSSGSANGAGGINALFGSVLGIDGRDALIAAAVAVAGIVLLMVIARPLLFASLDPVVAGVRGVPGRLVSVVFLMILAASVTEAVQVVGALLTLALLVMPAAIATRWAVRPSRAILLAIAVGLLITWSGLTLGYYLPYPVSFFITTLGFGLYVLTRAAEMLGRLKAARA